MSEKSPFRGCFDKQYGKLDQTLLKSRSQHLCPIHFSLGRKLCSKMSLLFTSQILGLLLNTLTTNEKYPLLNRGNLMIPIQMQLSQKQKTFRESFAPFLKFRLNLECFEKKDDPDSFFISEISYSENMVR